VLINPASNTHATFEKVAARGIHRNVIAILSKRTDLQGRDVLDFACGDGRTTHLLRQLGARVTPCDLFPEYYKLEDKPLPIDKVTFSYVLLHRAQNGVQPDFVSVKLRK
jgi:2-polyprenyl-3-methyl-5-hydroxy-6-metoxy-1,4-benzoquinol methylase